ncbi:class I SAM-dependent methyltransferase [Nannocystis sp. ILAH1]|uniref:class I SAM-dependent methyltransferase n=1 Tax=Nannocystis sp. ILAH1 TaxID=2996789 RepID=UPI0022720BA3|nr:class I SAM-dependent methyltransferase [Nannocystis sp. ILAH1]MCY0985775.1 class I SAM-dependent methyltransferase [Nannocystis sp. ILAH1]
MIVPALEDAASFPPPVPPAARQEEPPDVSINDIPRELAERAHMGTSHVPDRRGQQVRDGYLEHMRRVWHALQRRARDEAELTQALALFRQYRVDWLKRQREVLSARAGLVSTLVAGPSRFPVRQQAKRSQVYEKRVNEFLDWDERRQRAMLHEVRPSEPRVISSDRSDAVELLQRKVEAGRVLQQRMRAANQIIRRKLPDEQKIEQLGTLGIKPGSAAELLKKDFAGRIGFPDYELTNNLANIRRMEQRIAELQQERARPADSFTFDGGRVEENTDKNRVQIFFDSKPSFEVRERLKRSGFRWAPSDGAWQRQRNEAARRAVAEVLGVVWPSAPAAAEASAPPEPLDADVVPFHPVREDVEGEESCHCGCKTGATDADTNAAELGTSLASVAGVPTDADLAEGRRLARELFATSPQTCPVPATPDRTPLGPVVARPDADALTWRELVLAAFSDQREMKCAAARVLEYLRAGGRILPSPGDPSLDLVTPPWKTKQLTTAAALERITSATRKVWVGLLNERQLDASRGPVNDYLAARLERRRLAVVAGAASTKIAEADLIETPRLVPGVGYRFASEDAWVSEWQPAMFQDTDVEGASFRSRSSLSGTGSGPGGGDYNIFALRDGGFAAQPASMSPPSRAYSDRNARARTEGEERASAPAAARARAERGPAPAKARAAAASKLRAAADTLHGRAEQELRRPRNTNTPRRAGIAAGIDQSARYQQAVADSMRRVADAVERGAAPHLHGVSSRTHVELLRGVLARLIPPREEQRGRLLTGEDVARAKYPWPDPWPDHYLGSLMKLEGERGLKDLAGKFRRLFQHADNRQSYALTDPRLIREFEELGEKVAKLDPWMSKRIKDEVADFHRVQRMGLDTPEKFRAALGEFLSCCYGRPQQEDPIKAAERALVGVRFPGFVPTPADLADEVVALAGLRPGMRVLEPSAGSGALAEAIQRAQPAVELDVIERQESLRDLLAAKGFRLIGRDFLEHDQGGYDAIIQNPPFEDNQDVAHVRHAFTLLKPGGVLVSIMSKGPFFRQGKIETEFVRWLESMGGTWRDNDEGAFLKSSRPTNVATVTVHVRRPTEVAHVPRTRPEYPIVPIPTYVAPRRPSLVERLRELGPREVLEFDAGGRRWSVFWNRDDLVLMRDDGEQETRYPGPESASIDIVKVLGPEAAERLAAERRAVREFRNEHEAEDPQGFARRGAAMDERIRRRDAAVDATLAGILAAVSDGPKTRGQLRGDHLDEAIARGLERGVLRYSNQFSAGHDQFERADQPWPPGPYRHVPAGPQPPPWPPQETTIVSTTRMPPKKAAKKKAAKKSTSSKSPAAKTAAREGKQAGAAAKTARREGKEAQAAAKKAEREGKQAQQAAKKAEREAKQAEQGAKKAEREAKQAERERAREAEVARAADRERREAERLAQRERTASAERPLTAHVAAIDPVTEEPVRASMLGAELRRGYMAEVPTPHGRVTVYVDPDDIDPRLSRFVVPAERAPKYLRAATEQAADQQRRRSHKTRTRVLPFRSTRNAVQEYMRNNGLYHSLNYAPDVETITEWMSRQEVKRGKRHVGLDQTEAGKRLKRLWRAGPKSGTTALLQYLFGKARRWDQVPWDRVTEFERYLGAAIGRNALDRGKTADITVTWRPEQISSGDLPSPSEYGRLAPELQEPVKNAYDAERFKDAVSRSTKALKDNERCLSKDAARMVRLRIRTFRKYVDQPWLAPEQLCAADPRYGGEVCSYDPLETYLQELEVCCKNGTCDRAVAARWLTDAREARVPSDDIPF